MLEAQLATLKRRIDRPALPGDDRHLKQLRRELAAYFDGKRRAFDVALFAPGTPFQQQVWNELQKIPCGATASYRELARRIGAPKAARAVGRANGTNRIAIVIPCHRVVNDDGRLGGYGGGVWRKLRLLELEGAATPDMRAAPDARGARAPLRCSTPLAATAAGA